MKKIIIDTNFFLIPYNFKVDIFSEIDRICDFKHDIFIIDKTKDELESIITKQRGKNKRAAELGLALIKAKKPKLIKSQSKNQEYSVDDIILKKADKSVIVATQDRNLKRKLKLKKIPVIVLRQKKYLKIIR